jgi:hypothetical protein
MNIYRARGALFKVKLPRFSYTVIVKAIGVEYIGDLIYKSAIYHYLLPIQAKYIPLQLGDFKVDSLLYYIGAVHIVYNILELWRVSNKIADPSRTCRQGYLWPTGHLLAGSIIEGSRSPKHSRPPRSARNNMD